MSLPTYVGFVRTVMLGRNGLHRDVLLDIVERAGGQNPNSYLTTGNISFRCEPADLDDVVTAIESGIERVVERPTPVMIRTLDDLVQLIEREPFDDAPHPDPRSLLVGFVRHQITAHLELPIESRAGTTACSRSTAVRSSPSRSKPADACRTRVG